MEVLLDILVIDGKVLKLDLFENGGHYMEASTVTINHNDGHIKPSSSLGKADKSGITRNCGLFEHARPKQTNESISLQPLILQIMQDNMKGVDTIDVGVLVENAKVSCTTSDDLLTNNSLSMFLFSKVVTILPK